MASGGPKPPNLTRFTSESYESKVFRADPDWLRDSQRDVEYEMSSNKGGTRDFYGYYRSRGPYAP